MCKRFVQPEVRLIRLRRRALFGLAFRLSNHLAHIAMQNRREFFHCIEGDVDLTVLDLADVLRGEAGGLRKFRLRLVLLDSCGPQILAK